jgi:hypothetical protein
MATRFYIVKARERGVDVTWWDFQEDEIIVQARSPKDAARRVYTERPENQFAEKGAKLSVTLTHWDAKTKDYEWASNSPSRFYAWDGEKVVKTTAFEYYNATNLVVARLFKDY